MTNALKILSGICGLCFVVVVIPKPSLRNPFSFKKPNEEVLVQGIIHDLDLEVYAYNDQKSELQLKAFKIKSPST